MRTVACRLPFETAKSVSDEVPTPPDPQSAFIYTAPPSPRVVITFDKPLQPTGGFAVNWRIRYPSWRRSWSSTSVAGSVVTVRFDTTTNATVDNYIEYNASIIELVGTNGLLVEPFRMSMIPG